MLANMFRGREVSYFMGTYALTLTLFMFFHVFSYSYILHRHLNTLFYTTVVVVVTAT